MKLQVQSIHFDADQKLVDFIEKKTEKLDQFFDHIITGEVFLKLDNADNESNKIAEIKVHIPGHTLFSKEQCKTFEEAVDNAVDSMRRQLKKQKEKMKNVHSS